MNQAGNGKTRILLVEDDQVVSELLSKILELKGWEIARATCGEAALQQYAEKRFNLILMDLHLPNLSGFAATRQIRQREQNEHRPHTPILALTAYTGQEMRERCLKGGLDGFITKPIRMQDLYKSVEKHLSP